MAIVFAKPKRKDLYSLIIFIMLIIIFLLVVLSIFRKKSILVEIKLEEIKTPQINFSNLNNPILKILESYESFPEWEESVGRENPFVLPQTQSIPPKK